MCSASVQSYIPSLSLRIGTLARLRRQIFSPPSRSYTCILYKPQEACFATYQVTMSPSQILTSADKCALPFWDPNGKIVFFDIQPAEPGTFTVPGVIDLEIYRPGDIIETSWIYFKGDPQAGPQPGHPFERPFNDSAKFSIDIVRDNDTAVVLHEIMRKFSELLPSLRRSINRKIQHPPILRLSGKVARHLVGRAATQYTSRDSIARASTTSLAK